MSVLFTLVHTVWNSRRESANVSFPLMVLEEKTAYTSTSPPAWGEDRNFLKER
jgi:hypothetical protein